MRALPWNQRVQRAEMPRSSTRRPLPWYQPQRRYHRGSRSLPSRLFSKMIMGWVLL